MTSLRAWVHDHDSRWSFILPYIITAVLLGIFASLFWVTIVMFSHFLLELWRHRMLKTKNIILVSLWHTKLDFALVAMGLALAVYSGVIIGVLGLGQAARGTAALSRVVVIQRAMRGVLLSIDDAGLLARGLGNALKSKFQKKETEVLSEAYGQKVTAAGGRATTIKPAPKPPAATEAEDPTPWRRPTKGDWFGIGLGTISIALILVAPVITAHEWGKVAELLLEEMTP